FKGYGIYRSTKAIWNWESSAELKTVQVRVATKKKILKLCIKESAKVNSACLNKAAQIQTKIQNKTNK
ncbi:MAG: hypothetical protein NZM05_12505, partial [Chloroherpetonaceae bacterium]|nr:hypothetical protein [Chloroherpetonaceae bacterium]